MVATDVIGTWIKKKYFIFGQSDSNFPGKKDLVIGSFFHKFHGGHIGCHGNHIKGNGRH